MPIAGSLLLEGTSEVGLGDDVSVRVEPEEGGLRLTILSGLDRDRVVLVGPGALRVPDLPATVRFEGGHPTVQADQGVRCVLEGQTVVAPIALLHGDSLEIDGRGLEVP
ncbi:MAG: hypothetical protein R3B99_02105 [Polyangiales bacterium]